jgi:hypothetical protein
VITSAVPDKVGSLAGGAARRSSAVHESESGPSLPCQQTARASRWSLAIHAVADFERSTMNLGRGALSPRARTGTPVSPIFYWLPGVRCP